MKNYREAIVWFNKALEQNPNDEFAQTSLIAAQKAVLK
jgi:tetratricopeptide (TPR) repeat protein